MQKGISKQNRRKTVFLYAICDIFNIVKKSRDILFKKIVDLIYGVGNIPTTESIEAFRDKFSIWKLDSNSTFGPLQPISILGQIHNVSENDVVKISNDLGIEIPKVIDLNEFNLTSITEGEARDYILKIEGSKNPEEDIIEILSNIEEVVERESGDFRPSCFQYIDMTNGEKYNFEEIQDSAPTIFRAISYLEKTSNLFREDKVLSMTVITVLKDGSASIWIPPYMDEKSIETLYDPLLEALRLTGGDDDKN